MCPRQRYARIMERGMQINFTVFLFSPVNIYIARRVITSAFSFVAVLFVCDIFSCLPLLLLLEGIIPV
jgi:hypothetical protein